MHNSLETFVLQKLKSKIKDPRINENAMDQSKWRLVPCSSEGVEFEEILSSL